MRKVCLLDSEMLYMKASLMCVYFDSQEEMVTLNVRQRVLIVKRHQRINR
jgi:hypothetical protein